MTDRVRSLTVILDHEMRDDDAEEVAKAIYGFRHVQEVKLGPVVDVNTYGAVFRVKRELWAKIQDIFANEELIR